MTKKNKKNNLGDFAVFVFFLACACVLAKDFASKMYLLKILLLVLFGSIIGLYLNIFFEFVWLLKQQLPGSQLSSFDVFGSCLVVFFG